MIKLSNEEKIFLTAAQAARLLNVSLATLKKFIYQGKIKTLKTPGGHHRINQADLFTMSQVNPGSLDKLADIFNGDVYEIAQGMINILEKGQKFCQGHAVSVVKISKRIADEFGFGPQDMHKLQLAAMLHDIGKITINHDILNKPTLLTAEEYNIIKTHPILGEEALSSIKLFNGVSSIVRQHHERYDGSGYPDGLKAQRIAQEARIIAVADAFDVMTSRSSYKNPVSKQAALEEIKKNTGSQFDPEVVEILEKIYKG